MKEHNITTVVTVWPIPRFIKFSAKFNDFHNKTSYCLIEMFVVPIYNGFDIYHEFIMTSELVHNR